MNKPRTNLDEKAQAAAFLRCQTDLSQEAIAKALCVSQSAVSRLLRHARTLGCLREISQFIRTADIDDGRMGRIERLLEYSDLDQILARLPTRTGIRLRAVRVFDSGSTDNSPTGINLRQKTFARAAASRLADRLRDATVVGVTWGSTVSSAIDALGHLAYPWPPSRDRKVIPVSAEPLRYATNEYTSSTLARRLHGIMCSDQSEAMPLALTGVPAFIPEDLADIVTDPTAFPKRTLSALPKFLRKFFEQNSSGYRELFIGPNPLVERIDMLVTSAGTADKPLGFCNEDLRKVSGLAPRVLSRLVLGDVGGVLLPAMPLSPRDAAKVASLNSMWTGIQRVHLETIARRAEIEGTPGVVLMAIGASRSTIVCQAVAEGLCSELIIDRDLATALPDEVRRRLQATRTQALKSTTRVRFPSTSS